MYKRRGRLLGPTTRVLYVMEHTPIILYSTLLVSLHLYVFHISTYLFFSFFVVFSSTYALLPIIVLYKPLLIMFMLVPSPAWCQAIIVLWQRYD